MKDIKLNSKGVAGLDLVLSVITMIFVIGLLVMVYALMGGALQTASYDKLTNAIVVNETGTAPTTAGKTLNGGLARDGVCTEVMIRNATYVISLNSANYTRSDCVLTNLTDIKGTYGDSLKYTYNYTWSSDNEATRIMNNTVGSIADAPDWFPIVIVITFMVVLVLLTVMIVRAVRGSGLMGGEIGA